MNDYVSTHQAEVGVRYERILVRVDVAIEPRAQDVGKPGASGFMLGVGPQTPVGETGGHKNGSGQFGPMSDQPSGRKKALAGA